MATNMMSSKYIEHWKYLPYICWLKHNLTPALRASGKWIIYDASKSVHNSSLSTLILMFNVIATTTQHNRHKNCIHYNLIQTQSKTIWLFTFILIFNNPDNQTSIHNMREGKMAVPMELCVFYCQVNVLHCSQINIHK